MDRNQAATEIFNALIALCNRSLHPEFRCGRRENPWSFTC